ncbi:MAG: hypothetical protein RBS40_02680 [Rhodocyclaceae bacterium]|jgi:hypothetical protein|nr:hypothetical protein [Rhodocyclaceae bacterium]
MEAETLEMLAYVALLGVLPYVAMEGYEFIQSLMARRRKSARH